MKVWKCKQGIDFDKSTTTVKEERNRTLHQMKLSIIISFGYIGAQSDLTQVMTLKQKVKKSKKSISLKVNCEQWLFYRTVYVISWTVNTALSTKRRKIVNLEHMFVSFQDFVGKTRNFSAGVSGQIRQRRGIYWTWDFGHKRKFNIENLFIGELLLTVKTEHCIFRTVTYLWMGGISRRE